MAAENLFQRQRYLADGRFGPRGVDGERQQIAVAAGGIAGERGQRFRDGLRIAFALEPRQLVDLQLAHRAVVDFQDVDLASSARPIFVDADHGLRAGIDARLGAGGGFLDAQLRQ